LSQQYYTRIRGTVRGPFSPDKLKELARRGQFSRVYHVSTDGVNWEPAANHPELLPEAREVKVRKGPVDAEEPSGGYELAVPEEPAAAKTSRDERGGQDDSTARAGWYYGSGGRQFGPVSFADLKQLAAQGALQPNAPVWTQGMAEWTEAASIPDLFIGRESTIHCPCCGNLFRVPDSALGKTVACPICQQAVAIPALAKAHSEGQPESPFGSARTQTKTGARPADRNGVRVAAVLAGAGLGLLLIIALGVWLSAQWEPGDVDAPPEVGCAACGTVMTLLVLGSTAMLVLNIALLVWVARDAKARGMDSAVLWMFLVMFTGLLGLVIYLFSRPQGNVLRCPTCGNHRLQASARCPHCGNP